MKQTRRCRTALLAGLAGLVAPTLVGATPVVITAPSEAGREAPGMVAVAQAVSETLGIDDFEFAGRLDTIFSLSDAPFQALTLPVEECSGERVRVRSGGGGG